MSTKQQNSFNFETALQELNTLVEEMERGNLSLETALKHFEKGVTLIRNCQTALKDAEQKVQILMEKDKQTTLEAYETESEECKEIL
jgi:exodeoxyribonuclease VII small subunit